MKTEKRVINIPKDQFDSIKKYCDENSLDMVSWMIKNSLKKVTKKLPEGIISSIEATKIKKEILESNKVDTIPEDWLSIVLKEINDRIKENVSSGDKTNQITWRSSIPVINIYGKRGELELSKEQIDRVREELNNLGYILSPWCSGKWWEQFAITW